MAQSGLNNQNIKIETVANGPEATFDGLRRNKNSVFIIEKRERRQRAAIDLQMEYVRTAIMTCHIQ
jgi:hypothetical protein